MDGWICWTSESLAVAGAQSIAVAACAKDIMVMVIFTVNYLNCCAIHGGGDDNSSVFYKEPMVAAEKKKRKM